MNAGQLLVRERWEDVVKGLMEHYALYAPVKKWDDIDYALIDPGNISAIIYNHPRPITPLKTFFLPVKQNVTRSRARQRMIIMGIPSCDLQALKLLDAIYLDEHFRDTVYQERREQTVLIGSDCHHSLEQCHCTVYGINPYPEEMLDVRLNRSGDQFLIEAVTEKGKNFLEEALNGIDAQEPGSALLEELNGVREKVKTQIHEKHGNLPGYEATGKLLRTSNGEIWKKYAVDCVSCGACATSCPTCTCFQLIDRPGFEKVRNIDTCQYPGFERVAAGEDPLKPLVNRFRNRYMCKYVWKPDRFQTVACTGCGRCIDACIGHINKNELINDMSEKVTT